MNSSSIAKTLPIVGGALLLVAACCRIPGLVSLFSILGNFYAPQTLPLSIATTFLGLVAFIVIGIGALVKNRTLASVGFILAAIPALIGLAGILSSVTPLSLANNLLALSACICVAILGLSKKKIPFLNYIAAGLFAIYTILYIVSSLSVFEYAIFATYTSIASQVLYGAGSICIALCSPLQKATPTNDRTESSPCAPKSVSAGDLEEYASLLKEGVISREDFDTMKARFLEQ